MQWLDWIVLISSLSLIVVFGILKNKKQENLQSYFLGDNSLAWHKVMFSVMATQASAITFLSAPGQAFTDGMRFVQYYFGLPLAIIVVSLVFVPLYHKLKVVTAYEYLENRFDVKVRTFTALLFLIQRGLAAGITIYAPSVVLSAIMGWNIYLTCFIMGILVVLYTLSGGAKAVAQTQTHQMIVILLGMAFATYTIFHLLPSGFGLQDTLLIAGQAGKLNVITTHFDLNDKYTLWSGLIGGFFLALSYFGTDQSQVGRYIAASSKSQSVKGLLMNAIVKIPMQLGILFIGVALYVFYIFNPQPLIFNPSIEKKLANSEYNLEYQTFQNKYYEIQNKQHELGEEIIKNKHNPTYLNKSTAEFKQLEIKKQSLKNESKEFISDKIKGVDTNDTNYIFLYFVLNNLPIGFIGLLIAVIFSASWSSTSSELNALSSTFVIDFYKRLFNNNASDKQYVLVSKIATGVWGLLAIGFAFLATELQSLIEAVNLLGSLFYGTILGVFLSGILPFNLKSNHVFIGAIAAEALVIYSYLNNHVAFLWLNLIGCIAVIVFALLIKIAQKRD